jgi:NADPH:quinone reductase-like Zn-dependent oxidoreductase
MKAAIVNGPDQAPVYEEFEEPFAQPGQELITVTASALSQFTKSRAAGGHYSSEGVFPCVVGADGVGRTEDGRRVYFALPEAPYGAMAQYSVVRSEHCVEIPDGLDDVTAAAIANPGMSAWVALAERARIQPGETVLINGATGTAGRLAVQLAKYMGAAKVIGTGRNVAELEEIKEIGADVVIPFTPGTLDPSGPKDYEKALRQEFAKGIDVVIDYLWGESAKTIIVAIAKEVEDGRPVRFVHVGGASREENIELPGAALRSSAILLMGSGVKSVPFSSLLAAVKNVFESVAPARLQIATRVVPLSQVEETWEKAGGKPRVVFAIE